MRVARVPLIFFLFVLAVTSFVVADYALSRKEGARDAHFAEVKYHSPIYAGRNDTWLIVAYNENCVPSAGGNASFSFVFYLNGELLWDEYNSTSYKTWQCPKGQSVAHAYAISPWQIIKPEFEDMKIELYWQDGNRSKLEDAVSFSLAVSTRVNSGDLLIFGYLAVYFIILAVLGFHMFTKGRIQVPTKLNRTPLASNQQINKAANPSPRTRKYLFLLFYIFVLASWQVINAFFYVFPLEVMRPILLIVQAAYVTILILILEREGSKARKYGFRWPRESGNYFSICLLLAVFYSFVAIFIPGIFSGYVLAPPARALQVFSAILPALVTSLASETVFRGYIQRKLTKIGGFPLSLLATSAMFAFYAVPLLPFDIFGYAYQFLSFLALGAFLSVLFYRTRTLLCPVVFYSAVVLIKLLTPVESVASDFAQLFLEFAALGLCVLVLDVLTVKNGAKRQSTGYV